LSHALAASTVAIPASRSSLGSRSCRVANSRSERLLSLSKGRLRRIGGDVLDPQMGQRPPDLGQLRGRDYSAASGVWK
jgi:hypothetical protein